MNTCNLWNTSLMISVRNFLTFNYFLILIRNVFSNCSSLKICLECGINYYLRFIFKPTEPSMTEAKTWSMLWSPEIGVLFIFVVETISFDSERKKYVMTTTRKQRSIWILNRFHVLCGFDWEDQKIIGNI